MRGEKQAEYDAEFLKKKLGTFSEKSAFFFTFFFFFFAAAPVK